MPGKSVIERAPIKQYPSYLNAAAGGKLEKTIAKAFRILESCRICPRRCNVRRIDGEKGFCRTGSLPRVYSFNAHFGEEPPISGIKGSGTIFFSGCNMNCVYCQNYKFSQAPDNGKEVSCEELADIMMKLQNIGCHNINLVTPTHIMPQILKAVDSAAQKGLNIPLVYNTSGYEMPDIIELLDGIVDIYLADMRYADNDMAIKYSNAPDYPEYSRRAIKEMYRQTGNPEIDKTGIMKKGLIIRYLVLPDGISGSEKTMEFISQELSPETHISLMSQYTAFYKAPKIEGGISRRIYRKEYAQAQKIMEKYGLYNGWIQDYSCEDNGLAGVNIPPGNF